MKRIVVILLSFLLLLACVPTPEEEIIISKADENLEQAIHHSEPVASYVPTESEDHSLRGMLGVPDRWTDAYEGSIFGGKLMVSIDAATEVPEVERVPVFAGRLDGARPEEAERLAKLLLGDGPYSDVAYDQKAEALEKVKLYQAWLDAIDAGLYGDASNARTHCEYLLQAYQKEYQAAEEPSAPVPWSGSFADASVSVMNADWTVFQWFSYYLRYMERGTMSMAEGDPRGAHPVRTDAERTASEAAEAFVEKLGLCGAKALGIYAMDEQTRRQLHTETGFDGLHFIRLAPTYAGIPVYQYFDKYHGSYNGAIASGYMEEEYAPAPEQETINIGVRDGHVIHCMWYQPFHVTETVNENVQLLPFETIADVFRKNIFLSIFADEDMNTIYLYVTDVKLSYMRIKQKDSDAYYLLPVWDFLGYAKKSEDEQLDEYAQKTFAGQTLLTINAVDGTVIDRTFGY